MLALLRALPRALPRRRARSPPPTLGRRARALERPRLLQPRAQPASLRAGRRRRARRRVPAHERGARARCPASAARPRRRSPRSASASASRSSTATSSACSRACSRSTATSPRRGAERELWDAATRAAAGARHRGLHAGPDGPRRDDLRRRARRAACSARCAVCCAAARRRRRSAIRSSRAALVRGRRENVWLELRWRDARLAGRSGRRSGVWAGPVEPARVRFDRRARRRDARAGPGSGEALPTFVHVLTHFDWHLQPLRWTFPARTPAPALAPLLARLARRAAGSRSTRRSRSACRRRCASASQRRR